MKTKTKNELSSLRTTLAFANGRACSNTLFHVLNRAFGHPMKHEENAAMPFAGGIMQHGYQCGMIWGAALAAGAQAYRLFGPGSHAETAAIRAAQRLVQSFHDLNNNINCLEITEIDKSSTTLQMITYFLLKGGTIGCFRMAAKYAPVAFSEINSALSENPVKAPSPPVSCASILAQKMDVSDQHTVMVAGLAGGIGLCGGACGALGAAIWFMGMKSSKSDRGKVDFKNPTALDTIENFLKIADYELECSEIVGRKFENIDDHAGYLRDGGCSKIIDALAS